MQIPDKEKGRSPRTILFFPRHAVAFRKMLLQCEAIKASSRYNPKIVFADQEKAVWEADCRSAGIESVNIAKDAPPDPFFGHGAAEEHGLMSEFFVDIARAVSLSRTLRRNGAFWRSLLRKENPIAVMMPGDRELGLVPSVLRAAKDVGIPAVICTSSVPNIESVAATRRYQRNFHVTRQDRAPLMNRLVATILPRQVSETPYGKMLFSPGWLTMGLRGARMLSRNPWVQSAGNSTDLIVDGERKKNEFTSLGAPEEKIRIVGDPIHDDLHRCFLNREGVRVSLLERFGLSGDRRLIAFAVPIYAEHGFMTMDEHLALLRDFAAEVATAKQNVILSFQPKSDPKNYTFLTDEFGFSVSDVPLVQFLPACDLLLSGNSSTQDWAILCGLPAINMDYVRIDDNAFVDCPGTIHVHTPAQFAVALNEILSNYDRFAQNQIDSARGRALFDGRVLSRYMDFMDELAARGMTQASMQKSAI